MKSFFVCILMTTCLSRMVLADNLNQVLAYSYKNNLTLSAERTGQKITDEEVSKAKSGYRPQIYAEGSVGRSHDKLEYQNSAIQAGTKYNQNPTSVQINLTQPLFSGLSTYHSVRAAKDKVRAGRHSLISAEQSVLLDTVSVYMNVIRDKAVLELQENQEKVLKRHLDSYRKRFKAGELTRTDVAQSEARASGATAKRIRAEGDLKRSEALFYSVVGAEPKSLEDVKEVALNLPKTIDEAMDLAMNHNPQILAARYAQQSAKYTVKAQKGALSPSVNLGASVGRMEESTSVDRNDYWKVSANLTVPLYQSGTEYANVRQAKLTENKYRILWNKTIQDVHAEVISTWENYMASKAQVDSIKAQIKASKLALDGVIREARVGSRTVLDVLDAEQEHLDNQVALVRVHHNEIVSAFSLMSTIGRMNPESLGLDVPAYDPQEYYDMVKNKWVGFGIE